MAMSATPISLLCRSALRSSLLPKAIFERFGRVPAAVVPGAGLEFNLMPKGAAVNSRLACLVCLSGLQPAGGRSCDQLLISDDQVLSISLTTGSGIGM